MRILSLTIVCSLVIASSSGRSLDMVNGPEQIVWDSVHSRYLVACIESNAIIQIDEEGEESPFAIGISRPLSMCIVDTLLLITGHEPHAVYALNLATGTEVHRINFPVSQYGLAGLAVDTTGRIYMTHQSGILYELDLESESYTFVRTINGVGTSQGMIYVPEFHELWVVGWTNTSSPIWAYEIANDWYHYNFTLPGQNLNLARDSYGNTYVSSWLTSCVHIIDTAGNIEPFSCGHSQPTGICIREDTEDMLIANYGSSTIDRMHLFLDIEADTVWAPDSLVVSFTGSSRVDVDEWVWDFGDDDSAFVPSPSHTYTQPGIYDVTLNTRAGEREVDEHTFTRRDYVVVLADTLIGQSIHAVPYDSLVEVTISATNHMPLHKLQIPVEFGGDLPLSLVDFTTVGCRTEAFETVDYAHLSTSYSRATIKIEGGEIEPGEGPVLILTFLIEGNDRIGINNIILDGYPTFDPTFYGSHADYTPRTAAGLVDLYCCVGIRGNIDYDELEEISISDLVVLVQYMFDGGPAPFCTAEADVDATGEIDIGDLVYLVTYMFQSGPEPLGCL